MKLSEIMREIKVAKEQAEMDIGQIDERIRGNFEAQARQARVLLPQLEIAYAQQFRHQAEIILLQGPGAAKAAGEFEKMGVITVDAQGFYKTVAAAASNLSPGNVLTMTSYVELQNSLLALSRATAIRLPKGLDFEEGNARLSLEDNMREIVRKQFSGAGAEPAWAILSAVNGALRKGIDKDPVAIVVYNTLGTNRNDYGFFPNVTEVNTTEGSESEVKSILKLVRDKLVAEGKVESKPKTETSNRSRTKSKVSQETKHENTEQNTEEVTDNE